MEVYAEPISGFNVAGGATDGWATALYVERAETEMHVVGCIVAEPLPGLELADHCGIEARHFTQDDLQTVYLAAVVKRRVGKLTGDRYADKAAVLHLARRGLADAGYWDGGDTRTVPGGSRWCDATLVALACQFPGPSALPHYAARLFDLDERARRAADLWAELRDVLAAAGKGRAA